MEALSISSVRNYPSFTRSEYILVNKFITISLLLYTHSESDSHDTLITHLHLPFLFRFTLIL